MEAVGVGETVAGSMVTDPVVHTEGINQLLNDEGMRQSYIEKGPERAELFSWEKTAAGILEVHKAVERELSDGR